MRTSSLPMGVIMFKDFKRFGIALSALLAAVGFSAVPQVASAAQVVEPCDAALVNPTAQACSGYYSGNLLGGSSTQIAAQIAGVEALGAAYTFDGNWGAVDPTKITGLIGGNVLDFGTTLYGLTVIGAHFGNVAGPAGNVTVFYLFDFGTEGANGVVLNDIQGFSNAVLYTTGAVPEPATWLLFILAFAAIGAAMRSRSRKTKGALATA